MLIMAYEVKIKAVFMDVCIVLLEFGHYRFPTEDATATNS